MTKNNHPFAAAYRQKKAREATKDKVGIACLWSVFAVLVINFPVIIPMLIFFKLLETKHKKEVVIIAFAIVNLCFIANNKGLFSTDQTYSNDLPDPEYLEDKSRY